MISGFFMVNKRLEMRDIYLKYMVLNNIIELIKKQRSVEKLQSLIKCKIIFFLNNKLLVL